MKKIKFLALLLGAVALAGCNDNGEGGKEPVGPNPTTEYFTFKVSNVAAYSATVEVTASAEFPVDWMWDVAYAEDTINDEYVQEYLQECYQYQLEQLEATEADYSYSKFLLDFCKLKGGVSDKYEFTNMLEPNTSYKVWACGLDMDGKAIYIQTYDFKTEALATDVKGNFKFSVSGLTDTAATITVTPPTDLKTVWYWDIYEADGYGVDVSLVSWTLESYLEMYVSAGELPEGATVADLVKVLGIDAKQSDSYTFEDLTAGTEYYIWACGLDANGNVATKIDHTTFTTTGSSSGGGNTGGGDEVSGGTAVIEPVYSNLTTNATLQVEEGYMESLGGYWDDYGLASLYGHENFYIELYGPYVGEDYGYIVLDLLAPAGATTPEGTYTVGYSGQYIALSSVYVDCGSEDDSFYAGCCYGFGEGETNSYADFESGTVKITKSGSNYTVVVDAKCGAHTIKANYTGSLAVPDYGDIFGIVAPQSVGGNAKVRTTSQRARKGFALVPASQRSEFAPTPALRKSAHTSVPARLVGKERKARIAR